MAVLCQRCARTNPQEAAYCYFDGLALAGSAADGPRDLAQSPFPTPLQFPSGLVCENFDQLALGCHALWGECWELLQNGTMTSFLAGVGRADLIVVAEQAVAAGERDRGVAHFIARLPCRNLAEPHLHVAPAEMQLGAMRPNQDIAFDLCLSNDGHRLIVGTVTVDGNWLTIEGAAAGQPHAVQFPHEQTIRIRVVTGRLAAGALPRVARIVVQTNAGSAEVVVSCTVPVLPFPDGKLAGCRSPRELAKEARRFPEEAAALFAGGAVQAWYGSNGWTYPVAGTPAAGKAAVQQYFEALGLTEPPLVVLDTTSVVLCGAPGRRLQKKLRLHTDDKRPIFASGRSFSPWLTVLETTANANRATVTIEALVPVTTVSQLETQLEVQSNGNQRFQVPVLLQIVDGGPSVAVPAASPPRSARPRLVKALLAVHVCALLATFAAVLLLLLLPDTTQGPLAPYAAALSASTCLVAEIDLEALEETRGLQAATRELQKRLTPTLQDLDLQPPGARPQRLFVALAPQTRPLLVWTFDRPVHLGRLVPRRFTSDADGQIHVDRFDPPTGWLVDTRGRLVSGALDDVRMVLSRDRPGQASIANLPLRRATPAVLPGALGWAAGDFSGVGTDVLKGVLGEQAVPSNLERFQAQMVVDDNQGLVLRGSAAFPSKAAAEKGRERLRGASLVPFMPLNGADWVVEDAELRVEMSLLADRAAAMLARVGGTLDKTHSERQALRQKREYTEDLDDARKALAAGNLFAARARADRLRDSPLVDADWFALDSAVAAAMDRAKLRAVLKPADALVDRADAGKVRELFERAGAMRPGDAEVVRGLEAARTILSVGGTLRFAEQQLRDERPEEAHLAVIKALKQLRATSPPWDAPPFREHRQRLLDEGATTGRRTLALLKAAASTGRQRAEALLAQKKLTEAVAQYGEAEQRLRAADALLEALLALDVPHAADAADRPWVRTQLAEIAAAAKEARIQYLLTQGDRDIEDVKLAFERAPENPRLVQGALDKLQRALKALEDADPPARAAAAGRIRALGDLRADFTRLLRPVTLDTAREIEPVDWRYQREQWMPGRTSDTHWLQAQAAQPVTLQSTSRRWPAEFVLEMDFALTNGYGAIVNDKWIYYTDPDPLAIVLHGPRGKRTVVSLGKDAQCQTYDEARFLLGKTSRRLDAAKDLAGPRPLRLVLRADGPRDGVETLYVRLNGRDIGATPLAGPIHSVQLCAANPTLAGQLRWYVAIYRLEVAWKGVKTGNHSSQRGTKHVRRGALTSNTDFKASPWLPTAPACGRA